MMCKTTERKQN